MSDLESNVLPILKKRRRGLRLRIKSERAALRNIRHKSRRVRHGSPIGRRIGFFTDRLQELEIVIDFIEGKMTEKAFVTQNNGDRRDYICGQLNKWFQNQP